mmetsp:Transcript_27558/g.51068  ORF Transcript_27558/g.51068 Transcript_27558/m.51068 type:complete len:226 (-) Transcript_27558:3123-3800(-)
MWCPVMVNGVDIRVRVAEMLGAARPVMAGSASFCAHSRSCARCPVTCHPVSRHVRSRSIWPSIWAANPGITAGTFATVATSTPSSGNRRWVCPMIMASTPVTCAPIWAAKFSAPGSVLVDRPLWQSRMTRSAPSSRNAATARRVASTPVSNASRPCKAAWFQISVWGGKTEVIPIEIGRSAPFWSVISRTRTTLGRTPMICPFDRLADNTGQGMAATTASSALMP